MAPAFKALFSATDLVAFVDFRENRTVEGEPSLISALQNMSLPNCPAVHIVVGNLDAGDIILCRVVPKPLSSSADAVPAAESPVDACIRVGGHGCSSMLADRGVGTQFDPLIVYERKTVKDLVQSRTASSGVPGASHLLDQVDRIKAFCALTHARPYFLIEKYFQHTDNGDVTFCQGVTNMTSEASAGANGGLVVTHHSSFISEDGVHSLLAKRSLVDGFSPWFTASTHDSARTIFKHAKWIGEFGMTASGWIRHEAGDAPRAVAVKKSLNATPEQWYNNILQAIPRMSAECAKVIMDKYPTFPALIKAYERCPEREKLLEDIVIEEGGDGKRKRRIGPALSREVAYRVTDAKDKKRKDRPNAEEADADEVVQVWKDGVLMRRATLGSNTSI